MLHPIEIGKKISLFRNNLGVSQASFAKLLDVTTQAVSKWEKGNSLPDIINLVLLSEIFNVKLEELLDYRCTYDDLNKKQNKSFLKNCSSVSITNNTVHSNSYQIFKYADKTVYSQRKEKSLTIKNTALEKIIYSGCDFENVKIINSKNRWCVYINNIFTNVLYDKSNIEHCQSKLNIWSGKVINATLKCNIYIHDVLKDMIIDNSSLFCSSYTNTTFTNVQFLNSSWYQGIFHNSIFKKCTFKNFKVTDCCFQKCTLIDCVFDKEAYKHFNIKNNKIVNETITD